jgi:hypothetical protein
MDAAVPTQAQVAPWWRAPWDFAVHAVVGILIFVVIALAAIAIELIVRASEMVGINQTVVIGLRVGEYSIFCADLIMFLVFTWRTTTRAIRGLK